MHTTAPRAHYVRSHTQQQIHGGGMVHLSVQATLWGHDIMGHDDNTPPRTRVMADLPSIHHSRV